MIYINIIKSLRTNVIYNRLIFFSNDIRQEKLKQKVSFLIGTLDLKCQLNGDIEAWIIRVTGSFSD